ncbi:hypothetical protein GW915_12495 [bacterium]|nr:hypothetical protein [bacterium]
MIEVLLNLGLLLTPASHRLIAVPQPESSSYGTWFYDANPEEDGYESLFLELEEDFEAPLPAEYLEFIGESKLAMRGYIQFTVDGYLMGPFPFGSAEKATDSYQPAFDTHYFYTYGGSPTYQYENFDLMWDLIRNPATGVESERMILREMAECDTGLCEKKYIFKRPQN